MWNLRRTLIVVACAIAVLASGYVGWRIGRPIEEKREVNAQVILTALRDRGFLVTQTYLFDQPVTITKTSGSALKDFFFGQTITARGVMEVNIGTDLSKLSADQVRIEESVVTVTVPRASVFNVRLVGPIDLKNTQGILKRVLQNDDGYNEALAELSRIAEESAMRPELLERANARATEDIARMLGFVSQGKAVRIELR